MEISETNIYIFPNETPVGIIFAHRFRVAQSAVPSLFHLYIFSDLPGYLRHAQGEERPILFYFSEYLYSEHNFMISFIYHFGFCLIWIFISTYLNILTRVLKF